MKKLLVFCLVICALALCGFSLPDALAEGTCEVVGHDWVSDAGILICSRCGAVDDSEERAALGLPPADEVRESVEADETVETIEAAEETTQLPDFEKYGIKADMQYKEVYQFTTDTRDMSALSTVGTLAVTELGVLNDEFHPEREGFQWCYVLMQASFFDENARRNGVMVMALCEDYYNIGLRGTSQRLDADGYTAYSVIFNGEETECRYKRTGVWSEWTTDESGRRQLLYSCMWELEIPEGYDGTVVGLYSSDVDWQDGQYINEVYSENDFRLFRVC